MTMPPGTQKAIRPVSASQVLRRLAELEENSILFYEGVVEGAESDRLRKLAASLIKAEIRHRDRFLRYAQRAETSADGHENALTGALPEDVVRLMSVRVFVPKERSRASAKYARDLDILKVAVRAEESLALLLTQLREYVPRSQWPYINQVIKEEWHHKVALEEILNKRLARTR